MLETAGTNGLPMASGDGVVRRTHPILAVYVSDYPEQLLVTGVKNGECPSCSVPRNSLGDGQDYNYRDLDAVLAALDSFEDSNPCDYANACQDAGVKPIHHPFWQDLPYLHIFHSIMPNILHQLYQGVLKHLLKWVKSVFGVIEIDARCRRLPPNHNIRLFMKGYPPSRESVARSIIKSAVSYLGWLWIFRSLMANHQLASFGQFAAYSIFSI